MHREDSNALGSSASFGGAASGNDDDQASAAALAWRAPLWAPPVGHHHRTGRRNRGQRAWRPVLRSAPLQGLSRAPSTVSLKGRSTSMFKNDPDLAWASVADASTAEEGLEVRARRCTSPQPRRTCLFLWPCVPQPATGTPVHARSWWRA